MTPLLLLALLAAPSFPKDPFQPVLDSMETEGLRLERRALGAGAAVLLWKNASGGQRLRVYELRGGKPRLVHLEPSAAARIELDVVHADGRLPDLLGDGSSFVAYRTAFGGTGQEFLHLLRRSPDGTWSSFHEPLPRGRLRDLDRDGRLELVAQEQPLGAFFSVECSGFSGMARTAFRTVVYRLERRGPVPAGTEFKAFFEDRIRELERSLSADDPRKTGRFGDAVGTALSLYYDYAEAGRRREGWNALSGLLKARPSDPRPVRRCLEEIRSALRIRLKIPEAW